MAMDLVKGLLCMSMMRCQLHSWDLTDEPQYITVGGLLLTLKCLGGEIVGWRAKGELWWGLADKQMVFYIITYSEHET